MDWHSGFRSRSRTAHRPPSIDSTGPVDDAFGIPASAFLALGPALCSAVLSFHNLGLKPLWLDEAYSVAYANDAWADLIDLILRHEIGRSLFYVLLKVWVVPFGDGEFAVRSIGALFAVGAVVMTYAVGVRLFGTRTGLAAGFLLAANPFYVRYAQDANGYPLLVFLAASSVYLFTRIVEGRSGARPIVLGLVNALLLYAHPFGAFVFLGEALSLLFLPRGTVPWKPLFVSVGLTVPLAAPFAVIVVTSDAGQLSWVAPSRLDDVPALFGEFTGYRGAYALFVFGVPSLLFLISLIRRLRRVRQDREVWRHILALFWFLAPILGVFVLSIFKPAFVPRYTIASLPAFALLVGIGVSELRPRMLSQIATVSVIAVSLHAVVRDYGSVGWDWRLATKAVIDRAQDGDGILFYAKPARIPFEYYYRRISDRMDALTSVYPLPLGTPINQDRTTYFDVPNPSEDLLTSVAERHPRLWVVLAHDMVKGRGWDSRPVIASLERKYGTHQVMPFNGITITLYGSPLVMTHP